MKSRINSHFVGALAFFSAAIVVPLGNAGSSSPCDNIANDVREAVAKDPAKVLMIVEDALVINETCACEVVKAAIIGSKADSAMVQQIVQTGMAVAPKMSAVIAECASAVAPDSGANVAALPFEKSGGKEVVNVTPVAPVADTPEGTDFSNTWATNIRGVYLIQPAAAGFVTTLQDEKKNEEAVLKNGPASADRDDDDANVNQANSRRTRNLVALSPAQAHP